MEALLRTLCHDRDLLLGGVNLAGQALQMRCSSVDFQPYLLLHRLDHQEAVHHKGALAREKQQSALNSRGVRCYGFVLVGGTTLRVEWNSEH